MNIGELTSEIESGTFDSDLIKIKEAVDARLKASRVSRCAEATDAMPFAEQPADTTSLTLSGLR